MISHPVFRLDCKHRGWSKHRRVVACEATLPNGAPFLFTVRAVDTRQCMKLERVETFYVRPGITTGRMHASATPDHSEDVRVAFIMFPQSSRFWGLDRDMLEQRVWFPSLKRRWEIDQYTFRVTAKLFPPPPEIADFLEYHGSEGSVAHPDSATLVHLAA